MNLSISDSHSQNLSDIYQNQNKNDNGITEFYMILIVTFMVGAVVVINTILQMIFSVIITFFTIIINIIKITFYIIKLFILAIKCSFNGIKLMYSISKYIFQIMNEFVATFAKNIDKFTKQIFCISEAGSDDEVYISAEEPLENNNVIMTGYEISNTESDRDGVKESSSHDEDTSSISSGNSGGGICNKKFIEYYQLHKNEFKSQFPTMNGTQIRKALYHKMKAELSTNTK